MCLAAPWHAKCLRRISNSQADCLRREMAVQASEWKVEHLQPAAQERAGRDWSALGALVSRLTIEAVAEHTLRPARQGRSPRGMKSAAPWGETV
jgi:hypothetical protein